MKVRAELEELRHLLFGVGCGGCRLGEQLYEVLRVHDGFQEPSFSPNDLDSGESLAGIFLRSRDASLVISASEFVEARAA